MNTLLDLTHIRHRFEPSPKPTAMEQFWINERRERRLDWLKAIAVGLFILLLIAATTSTK